MFASEGVHEWWEHRLAKCVVLMATSFSVLGNTAKMEVRFIRFVVYIFERAKSRYFKMKSRPEILE